MAALLMRIGMFVSVHAGMLLAVIVFAWKRNVPAETDSCAEEA